MSTAPFPAVRSRVPPRVRVGDPRSDLLADEDPAPGSQVQAVPLSDGSYRVWNTFQIGGTPVEMYHLVGSWTVSVALDGGAAAATATFALQ